jgi:copper resistance protein D
VADALVLWVHIFAATLFVGPQVFLFVAAIPAMRTIDDVAARTRATRVVTSRFGWLGGGALVVLIATGLFNFEQVRADGLISVDAYPRYFWALTVKLTLVAGVVLLTGLHAGLLGRRLLRLQEEGAGEDEIARTRRWSVLASAVVLAASVVILLCAALMSSNWSKM